jgi:hypothetical protein
VCEGGREGGSERERERESVCVCVCVRACVCEREREREGEGEGETLETPGQRRKASYGTDFSIHYM